MDDLLIAADVSDERLDEVFRALDERHENIYEFVLGYMNYILAERDYGQGIPLTMIEVHALTYIGDHPGTTITELAQRWHRTKSAFSQTISHLEEAGLVTKRRREDNARIVALELTEAGEQMSRAHKRYDIEDIAKTTTELRRTCSEEEIDAFYKVLACFNRAMKEEFDAQPPRRRRRSAQ